MFVPQTQVIVRREGVEIVRRTVAPGEYVIGCGQDCALRIEGAGVAEQHARLFVSYQDWSVADLGSMRGTQLNEESIGAEAVRVWPSQIIRVGEVTIELREVAEAGVDPPVRSPAQETIRRHLPPEMQGVRRYQIGRQVAKGGMGAILDALDVNTRRNVAMKVMLDGAHPGDVLRFIEEAQVTAQLDHPNIVPVYELSVNEQGEAFYTMKMVRGVTLKEVLTGLARGDAESGKKYPLAVLLTVFQKVCDAIAFAHSKGVLHRDLKPANIMLGDYGEVLVMDWGLARLIGSTERPSGVRTAKADEGEAVRTLTGSVMGTPAYMSPEQARGEIEKLDARSDIYALGTILFELLHLRPAVVGANVDAVLSKAQRGEIDWVAVGRGERPTKAPVPESLVAVCRKALAPSLAVRYARVEDLQADLLAYQNGFATSAEHKSAWKQFRLLILRHKAASIGIAAVLLVASSLGAKVYLEGRRAEQALAELKKTAPALRQLADSEAGFQRFGSALEKLDAALALDPGHLPSYWRRAWLLLGLEDFPGSAAAIRLAQAKDPAKPDLAAILPIVEELAAAPADVRWTAERSRQIYAHFQMVAAAGEIIALQNKLKLSTREKAKHIQNQLDSVLGKYAGMLIEHADGTIELKKLTSSVVSLEALRGLPINDLDLSGSSATDLEPLRGMPLSRLWLNSKIQNLEPLRGMKLRGLFLADNSAIVDWSPIRGMPLQSFNAGLGSLSDVSFLDGAPLTSFEIASSKISDLSGLAKAPLKEIGVSYCPVADLSPLAAAPLEKANFSGTSISDLSLLRGKPLSALFIERTAVSDLTPLRGMPIVELSVSSCPITDFRPLLELPRLEKLSTSSRHRGLEILRGHPSLRFITRGGVVFPVAEFWSQYNAMIAQEDRAALKQVLAGRSKTQPDGTLFVELGKTGTADLSPLKGLNVSVLNADHNPIVDLSPLAGLSALRELSLQGCPQITDLSPLKGLSLKRLYVDHNEVADISPLRGMPLERLTLDDTRVKDLSPLLDMPKLRWVMLPRNAENIELLRPLKNLEHLGWEGDWEGDSMTGRPQLTAAEFWGRWDRLKEKGK